MKKEREINLSIHQFWQKTVSKTKPTVSGALVVLYIFRPHHWIYIC